MLIRAERPDDVEAIERVTADAFSRPGVDQAPETGLVAALRAGDAWIRQLSLVALVNDRVVGHCLTTRAHVGETQVLALGPIAVMPEDQGKGVGSALMRETIDIAIEMSEPLIGLLGDPGFYRRFGFVHAASLEIEPPEPAWGAYFQVRVLNRRGVPRGTFQYAAPFGELS